MKSVTIQASPYHEDAKKRFTRAITVVLPDTLEKEYEVVAKDFPEKLPTSWLDPDDKKEKRIEWISNFGLRKADGKFADQLPKGQKYQLKVPKGAGKLVYFDGSRIQKLIGQVKGEQFEAELDLGDPPIGETVT